MNETIETPHDFERDGALPEQLPLPPRPSLAPIRQTFRFMKDAQSLLSEARSECGDIFLLRLYGMGNWVFVCSPELAQEMLRAPEEYLSAGEANFKFLSYLLGPDASVSLDGPPHQLRRSFVSPHLNGKPVLDNLGIVREATEKVMDSWPRDRPFSLIMSTRMISFQVLFRVVLGISDPDKIEEMINLAADFFDAALLSPLMIMPALQWDLGPLSPWGRILRMRKKLHDAIEAEVERCRRDGGKNSHSALLTSLTTAVDEDGNSLSNRAIVHEIVNLISAGQETTSKVMAWTIFGVISNREVLQRLRDELFSVLGDRPLEASHLPRLEYLEAIINEGIRYRPLGPFIGVRVVKKPFIIGGYVVPPGTIVAHCFSEITKNSKLFQQTAGFSPDNFFKKKLKGTEWSPFGGGPRMCVGRGLAMLELKTVLATIFRQAEIEPCSTDVKSIPGSFSSLPEKGLQVRLIRRDSL